MIPVDEAIAELNDLIRVYEDGTARLEITPARDFVEMLQSQARADAALAVREEMARLAAQIDRESQRANAAEAALQRGSA